MTTPEKQEKREKAEVVQEIPHGDFESKLRSEKKKAAHGLSGAFEAGEIELNDVVFDIAGDYSDKIALKVKQVDEIKGMAYVDAGDAYPPKWVPIQNLRSISAVTKKAMIGSEESENPLEALLNEPPTGKPN